MPLGRDQQYDESWAEQDKIRRRQELKYRLKAESVEARYNPFSQMKDKPVVDPAINRYMDMRKKGRMPNAPFNPKLFFSISSMCILPIFILAYAINAERKPYLEQCAKGDFPLEKRMFKHAV